MASDRMALQPVIQTTRTWLVPTSEHQWHQWSEISAQSTKILKDNTNLATSCSPCSHLTTDKEASAAIRADYRAASFWSLKVWSSKDIKAPFTLLFACGNPAPILHLLFYEKVSDAARGEILLRSWSASRCSIRAVLLVNQTSVNE